MIDDEHEWWEQDIKLQIETGEHTLKVYKRGKLIDKQVLIIDWNGPLKYLLPDTIAAVADSA